MAGKGDKLRPTNYKKYCENYDEINWGPKRKIMDKTLESFFRDNIVKNVIDFTLRASITEDNRVVFYIHPLDVSGDTVDFEVDDNILSHNRDIKTI